MLNTRLSKLNTSYHGIVAAAARDSCDTFALQRMHKRGHSYNTVRGIRPNGLRHVLTPYIQTTIPCRTILAHTAHQVKMYGYV